MRKVKIAGKKIDLKRGVDHIGVTVCAVIHDGNGNILMMKRGAKARDEHGHWDICGGAVEFGESIIDAIKREVKEELCAPTQDVQFLTVYDAHRQHNGNKTHWVALLHAVRVDPNTVKNGEPHKIDDIKWFNSANLPTPLHSQFHKALTVAMDRGILK